MEVVSKTLFWESEVTLGEGGATYSSAGYFRFRLPHSNDPIFCSWDVDHVVDDGVGDMNTLRFEFFDEGLR